MLIASDGSLTGDWFKTDGIHEIPNGYDAGICRGLAMALSGRIPDGADLFLSEIEFDLNPQYKGVNPQPGRNILEQFVMKDFEFPEVIHKALVDKVGEGYSVLDRKLVCGVPKSWVPEWVMKRIEGNPVNNLGAYVRPEYRHTTFFLGIDWHQDIIDWPGREADFVTLYVYLGDVGMNDCPLRILPGSHAKGAQSFPHRNVDDYSRTTWLGSAGDAAIWHPFLMHGTMMNETDRPRRSLRYLIKGDPLMLRVNGPEKVINTRIDLREDGSSKYKGGPTAQ